LGDPLAEANTLLDWESFQSIKEGLYDNKTDREGHPNIDFVLMTLICQKKHPRTSQASGRRLAFAKISF